MAGTVNKVFKLDNFWAGAAKKQSPSCGTVFILNTIQHDSTYFNLHWECFQEDPPQFLGSRCMNSSVHNFNSVRCNWIARTFFPKNSPEPSGLRWLDTFASVPK